MPSPSQLTPAEKTVLETFQTEVRKEALEGHHQGLIDVSAILYWLESGYTKEQILGWAITCFKKAAERHPPESTIWKTLTHIETTNNKNKAT